jgi:hypothetical protein
VFTGVSAHYRPDRRNRYEPLETARWLTKQSNEQSNEDAAPGRSAIDETAVERPHRSWSKRRRVRASFGRRSSIPTLLSA